MTPLKLSVVWYRRFYATTLLLSLALPALFLVNMLSLAKLPEALTPSVIVAGLSGAAAILSLIFLIMVKKVSASFWPSYTVYLLLVGSTGLALWESGIANSALLPLWAVLSFVGPIFAAYGWIPIFAGLGGAIAVFYLDSRLSAGTIASVTLTTILPLISGLILWRDASAGAPDEATRNVKHLANELSEVAQKSEIIINAIGDGVIAVDGKGTIDLINPAAQEILGWGKQDAMALNYKSVLKLHDDNNHEIDPSQDPLQQVLNTNQTTRANKLMGETHSGKNINLSIVVSPIGEPGAGAIAVFRDVTKERAEEREQAEFISTASHEMRTPVASIEGYLGLASNPNTATVDDRARGYIVKAHEAAQHLGRLFQDLLDVSKSEDGRMANNPRVVDLAELAQIITQGLQQKAADKGLRLVFKPEQNVGQKKIIPVYFVNQDNDHIREVLDNLIENAIKYTPQGEVVVDIEGGDDKVTVSVKDSGLGIPAEDVPHLFQKFYRVDNVDRQDIGGTGLGLYLSRRLAEAMQGRLWVESVYQQGSTFFLELPRISNVDAQSLRAQQAAQLAAQPQQTAAAPVALAPAPPITADAAQAAVTAQAPAAQPAAPVAPASNPTLTPTGGRSLDGIKPATTVPRGQSLTREQIQERARQLEELARQQRAAPPEGRG